MSGSHSEASEGASQGPGRPRISSRAIIERTAIELFLRSGFDSTTMEEIATACGLGRTTVFRYFRFKEAILWYGFDVHLDDLRAQLDAQPASGALAARTCDAVLAAFLRSQDDEGLWIARFRILQASSRLSAETSHRWLLWAQAVSDFAGRRTARGDEDALVAAFGGAIQAAYLTTLRTWTTDVPDAPTRDRVMRENIHAVARLFSDALDVRS